MESFFDKSEFYKFILDNNIIGVSENPIKLKSGRESHFYVNWRLILSDCQNVDVLSDYVLKYMNEKGFEGIVHGVPSGATPLGFVVNYRNDSSDYYLSDDGKLISKDELGIDVDHILQVLRDSGVVSVYGSPYDDSKYVALLAQFKLYEQEHKRGFSSEIYPLCYGRDKVKNRGPVETRYFVSQPKGKTSLVFVTDEKKEVVIDSLRKIDCLSIYNEIKMGLNAKRLFVDLNEIPDDKKKVIVVEDVTTTGGSLIEEIKRLRRKCFIVDDAIGLTNRMELRDDGLSVEEALRRMGVKYHYLSDAIELLPEVIKEKDVSDKVIEKLKEEFGKYGVRELII